MNMLTAIMQASMMNRKESNSGTTRNNGNNEYQLQSDKATILTEIPITFDAPTDKDTRVSCEKHPFRVYGSESSGGMFSGIISIVGTFIFPVQPFPREDKIIEDHSLPVWADHTMF